MIFYFVRPPAVYPILVGLPVQLYVPYLLYLRLFISKRKVAHFLSIIAIFARKQKKLRKWYTNSSVYANVKSEFG